MSSAKYFVDMDERIPAWMSDAEQMSIIEDSSPSPLTRSLPEEGESVPEEYVYAEQMVASRQQGSAQQSSGLSLLVVCASLFMFFSCDAVDFSGGGTGACAVNSSLSEEVELVSFRGSGRREVVKGVC